MLAPPGREVSLPESGQNIPKQQRRFIALEEQVGLGEAAKAAAAAAAAASKGAREKAQECFCGNWFLTGKWGTISSRISWES